jgi:plastocyanin
MSRFHLGVLAFALVSCGLLVASCGSSSTSPTGPTSSANLTITINGIDGNMSFNPPSATMTVGQTVAWVNSDSITHEPVQDGGAWDAGSINGGSTSTPLKMTNAGTFSYHCAIHPTMVGVLTVNP